MRSRCIEVFKTLNGLNPVYMKDIFKLNNLPCSSRRPYDFKIPRVDQTTFGLKREQDFGITFQTRSKVHKSDNIQAFNKDMAGTKLQMQLL